MLLVSVGSVADLYLLMVITVADRMYCRLCADTDAHTYGRYILLVEVSNGGQREGGDARRGARLGMQVERVARCTVIVWRR